MNRIRRYGAAILAVALLLAALSGCARQASAEAEEAGGGGVEIISRDFSHDGYVDSIAFLVQTGAGLTGSRYVRQTVSADGEVRQEYYVLLDPVPGSSAVYQLYASRPREEYEKYRLSLDTLVAGISIAAVAK